MKDILNLIKYGDDLDALSTVLDLCAYSNSGLAKGFLLRKSHYEKESDEGAEDCQSDWVKYVGGVPRWGGRNPFNGNAIALTAPLCKKDRMALVSYAFEYAFIHDDMEDATNNPVVNIHTEGYHPNNTSFKGVESISGLKQLRAKIFKEMQKIDPECAQVFIEAWRETNKHNIKDQNREFPDMESYLEYRRTNIGGSFSLRLILFGQGTLLREDKQELVAELEKACFLAFALSNDYFSFEVEYRDFLATRKTSLPNAVWLYMHMESMDVETAKKAVVKLCNELEEKVLRLLESFLEKGLHHEDPDFLDYLRAIYFGLAGNVAWSTNCPRYQPHLVSKPDPVPGQSEKTPRRPRGSSLDLSTKTDDSRYSSVASAVPVATSSYVFS